MKKYLIPITTILLASCEQNSHAQNTAASSPPAINTECKNLHKVVDIDDLLYQMYSNIDSHCLFEMPTAELEKIWEIPILDNTNLKYEDEMQKQYQDYEKKDFLFLRKHKYNNQDIEVFDIHIGKQYALKNGGYGGKTGTKIPIFLPTPKIIEHPNNQKTFWEKIHNYIINNQKNSDEYNWGNFYYWNNIKNYPMLAIQTNGYMVRGISIHFYFKHHDDLIPKFSKTQPTKPPHLY